MVTLVIAEKPAVARDIARVLGARASADGALEGQGFRVSWCVGHLCELCEPEDYDPAWKAWSAEALPILPDPFRTRPRKGALKQLGVLRRLAAAPDVTAVVNACDAGREGELIFRWVWDAIAPRRRTPQILRLWVSSLTDRALRDGFARLEDARAYDRLGAAARARAEADWLVGINATRAMTLLGRRSGGKSLLSVGRVQTPTLALVVARDAAIAAFVPEPFWKVRARFDLPGDRRLEATLITPHPEGRLPKADLADAIAAAVRGRPAKVEAVTRDQTARQAPALYDLTTLQKEANRRFGLSAARTLAAAQALYERHKALTYPRTDSRFVTADVAAKLPAVLTALRPSPWGPIAAAALAGGPRPTRRIVDAAEVGDHHAILPTGKLPDLARLSADERHVYELVVRRTLAVFLPAAVFAKVEVVLAVPTPEATHRFLAQGTTRLVEGWELAEPPPPQRASAQDAAHALPAVHYGEPARVADTAVEAGATQAPPRHTEATLLAAMEHAGRELDDEALARAMRAAGLGTPATRAAILETLIARDYLARDARALVSTAQGRALIAALPVAALRSAELTGRWELALSDLAEGRGDTAAFMAGIRAFTTEAVAAMRTAEAPGMREAAAADAAAAPVLGACPRCGQPVREGRKAYGCAAGRECGFAIFKTVAGKKISPALAQVLLARGRSQRLPGFRSKQGKPFQAALVLGEDGKVSLDFELGRAQGRGAQGEGGGEGGRGGGRKRGRGGEGGRGGGGEGGRGGEGGGEGEGRREGEGEGEGEGGGGREGGRGGEGEGGGGREGGRGGGRKRRGSGGAGAASGAATAAGTGTAAATATGAGSGAGAKARKPSLAAGGARSADPRPRCPKCKEGRVISGRRGWGCSRYREGCTFVVWFVQGPMALRLPDDEAERLFRKGATRLIADLVPDAEARVVLDVDAPEHVRIELGARRRKPRSAATEG